MKHTVTITHKVEAPSWDLAVEAVLRAPVDRAAKITVKTQGKQLVHVAPSSFRYAAGLVQAQAEREHD